MISLKDTPRGINKAELGNFDPCKNHVHLFDPCKGAELWVRWVDVEAAVKELKLQFRRELEDLNYYNCIGKKPMYEVIRILEKLTEEKTGIKKVPVFGVEK